MQREQILGAADPITEKFRSAPLDARGEPRKRARKSLKKRAQLGLGERRMNEQKSVVQTEIVWSVIGVAEKDNGQVLDCCFDNQCFACGVGILGESRGKYLDAWDTGFWRIREWNCCSLREIAGTTEMNWGSSQGNVTKDDK
jgi:hypothetical protein